MNEIFYANVFRVDHKVRYFLIKQFGFKNIIFGTKKLRRILST